MKHLECNASYRYDVRYASPFMRHCHKVRTIAGLPVRDFRLRKCWT